MVRLNDHSLSTEANTKLSLATVLTSAQHLEASNRPSASEYNAVRMYLRNNKPLVDEEMEYLQYKEDLITLRPGRDHAWLDRRIERSIHILQRPFPFINVCRPSSSTLASAH